MASKEINYWLMKSEPDAYSIYQLKEESTTLWDGIRNYQARNFMRSMKVNDQAFFYHSNCKPPCIVGLMEVTNINLTDPTQFDPNSKYYGINFEKRIKNYLEFRYIGGKDWDKKTNKILGLLDLFIVQL